MDTLEKNYYTDEELQEFKDIILKKLNTAKDEFNYLQEQIKNSGEELQDGKLSGLEDGSSTLEKEHLNKLMARQAQYIQNLNNALIRIKNKTYGVCRITGKLIGKDRLRAVPHATLSIEAKNGERK
ncbi:MAG: TraR/DksA C4-type zinc finger protein [Sphingobacteriales bacterium]|nr:TraR/DksA C4-type zinc finger protein [Sphingobacteriales bacterium]